MGTVSGDLRIVFLSLAVAVLAFGLTLLALVVPERYIRFVWWGIAALYGVVILLVIYAL